jgi:protein-S-isoprenylcysteine O-methyltransferase Ste14
MAVIKGNNRGAILLVVVVLLVLGVVFYVFPPWLVATDAPDKAQHAGMAQLPVAIWWIGSGLFAVALIYGILHTRNRSNAEKMRSDEATTRLYEEENRDEKRAGLS